MITSNRGEKAWKRRWCLKKPTSLRNLAAAISVLGKNSGVYWDEGVCRSESLSLLDKSPTSTVILPRVSSILFKSVLEFIRLEMVFWRPSIFPEKSLWSGYGTTLSMSRPKDALTDFMTTYALGITKLSITVKRAWCTLVSTVAIMLFNSLHILPLILLSSVYVSPWEPSTGAELFAIFEVNFFLSKAHFFNLDALIVLVYQKVSIRLI